eukprot:gene10755-10911_t
MLKLAAAGFKQFFVAAGFKQVSVAAGFNAHPGGYDPRVVVAHLRAVLGCYGTVVSVSAYGIQKMFNWVPEAFMLQYAPQRLPGGVWVGGWVVVMFVLTYYNSQGMLFVPQYGHQISLKYVLLREGVEVRVVQNQKRAVDVSLANGLQDLLKELLRRDAAAAEAVEDVVVVVSDKTVHGQVLTRFQKAGIGTIAVARKAKKATGADLTLKWPLVVAGRYDCSQAQ